MSASSPPLLSAHDRRLCHESIRAGSKSFYAASRLLPRNERLAARALYAFCRSSDDLVDDAHNDGHASDRLRRRIELIYDGRPIDLVCDRAFAAVARTYRIPREIPLALIEGYGWDEAGRDYETLDALMDYAARVAATVGVMMTLVMGTRERAVLARAADLGLAMQLTNIARDVGEDARRGRIYLPLRWLDEAGIDPDRLRAAPRFTPALGAVVSRLLDIADQLYDRALTGVAGLPLDCRPAIRSAALIYQEIGREIRRAGCNSIDARAYTTARRKGELIAVAALAPFPLRPPMSDPPHPSVQSLVEWAADRDPSAPRGFDAKFGRMLEIMAEAHSRRQALEAVQR
ncbi:MULTISPECIES: phytoene/squalene synthase family protein [unclassified Roseitalea]|uniref:phytoene/squalene synthase family protein n=1 Tax=unclassified Roseitalea TaxID=2639107 RepID=UPI00273D4773|nr:MULTISPECIES: phytoene/squalene synthase family protein [unclassified Roseitalea]